MVKTFCVLPWYNHEIYDTSTTACCLIKGNPDINDVKTALLEGQAHPACNQCWQLEQQGQQSRRQQENTFLDYKIDRDIERIRNDCIEGKNTTLMYQVMTSNLCNQACVSCNSAFSSRWRDLEPRMDIIPKPLYEIHPERLTIDYAHAKKIALLGGEPMFDAKTFEILERLIKAGNTDCFVGFVTNGSIQLNTKQLEVLSKFSDLNICISIDGIESRFEYMRWPAKWEALLKNIEQYRSVCEVSVSYTISSLNAIYYNETVAWFNSQNLKFTHNVVSTPNWLSLDHAPIEIRERLKDIEFFNHREFNNPIALSAMHDYIIAQDRAKRTNLGDYMPKVAEIFNNLKTEL